MAQNLKFFDPWVLLKHFRGFGFLTLEIFSLSSTSQDYCGESRRAASRRVHRAVLTRQCDTAISRTALQIQLAAAALKICTHSTMVEIAKFCPKIIMLLFCQE